MVHKFSYQQRMLYKMALTPQMRQSIRLLGMSTKDLIGYIEEVAAQNPFLQKLYEKKSSPPRRVTGVVADEHPAYTQVHKENPRTALVSQLRMSGTVGKILEIAEYLIYEMDENGYIAADLEEISDELSADIEEARKALLAIQGLEPAGIGARDVRECLQLQLKRRGREKSLEYNIVTNFINELAVNDIKKISEGLEADQKSVQKALSEIKKLNPRPASTILGKLPENIVPDMVAAVKNKKVYLELNRDWMPHLKLYNPYENKLEIIKDPEAKKFMKENMNSARHLIDGVKRREDTMCRVTNYILEFQKEAFTKNIIKTLTIKDVAKALKLHISTISRTVANKYVQIDEKVLPLGHFLSHGVKMDNGTSSSKTTLKNRIKELVKNENKAKPLSDNAIKEALNKEGAVIKRRTVAKYREGLRILPTHLRKSRHP